MIASGFERPKVATVALGTALWCGLDVSGLDSTTPLWPEADGQGSCSHNRYQPINDQRGSFFELPRAAPGIKSIITSTGLVDV